VAVPARAKGAAGELNFSSMMSKSAMLWAIEFVKSAEDRFNGINDMLSGVAGVVRRFAPGFVD
jgi:hypothetical protein